ncbi:hypothetical protein SCOCK_10198 [Actinacidiphila cocklensis]|uniref:Uncharacterized protein n=1 Tax=Actinacidiphila cocklensis TaxID=887465 RepID=A0A9W4GMZ6_9ACTN|nr:hypothetical protein SCOCK_10198 [Actinacidiphila cocklensis]
MHRGVLQGQRHAGGRGRRHAAGIRSRGGRGLSQGLSAERGLTAAVAAVTPADPPHLAKGNRHALHHRRPGELHRHRAVLRGPRQRAARRTDPRLPAGRALLGEAAPRPARRRPPGHHLRPARLRPLVAADHRVRLRHLRRRPRRGADRAGPHRRGARRLLHGHR